MDEEKLKRYGGWLALTSGSIGLLGMMMMVLFFAVYLSPAIAWAMRGIDGYNTFGQLSDTLPIPAAAAMGLVATFYALQRKKAHAWSTLAAFLGPPIWDIWLGSSLLRVTIPNKRALAE